MNWDQVEGNWKQMSGKIRERWGRLTDDEVERAKGSEDQLVGTVQAKYGLTKEKAREQVNEFLSDSSGYMSQVKDKVQEKVHDAKDYLQNRDYSEMAGDLKTLISRYPVQSLVIGIGLGYLLGRGMSATRSS